MLIMTIKQTSVNIDVEKWNTLKARGYKLQDIVDTAFNNLLDINLADNLDLNKEKNDLIQKKKYLLQDLEEVEKEYTTKKNDLKSKIHDVDFKLTEIEKLITGNEEKAKEEERAEEEKRAALIEHNILFNSIVSRFLEYAANNPNGNRMDFFNNDSESKEYCKKYDVTLEDLSEKVKDEQIKLVT